MIVERVAQTGPNFKCAQYIILEDCQFLHGEVASTWMRKTGQKEPNAIKSVIA